MNPYLKHLERVEFVVTMACTGRCKHCSQGDHPGAGESIDRELALRALRGVARVHNIRSVMTFGGEPLLFPDTVCAIHSAARQLSIPQRQLITNGYFTMDKAKLRDTARQLAESGVNDLLLSVDAFHQETIPLESVKAFADALLDAGVPVRTQPAWLVSDRADNPYNHRTRQILNEFARMGIHANDGNVVFAGGNARKYLSEYLDPDAPSEDPYREDPRNLHAISFEPNGAVLNGNIHESEIEQILLDYRP